MTATIGISMLLVRMGRGRSVVKYGLESTGDDGWESEEWIELGDGRGEGVSIPLRMHLVVSQPSRMGISVDKNVSNLA